ncbi:hypothetical protein TKK_0001449 [Trichogramma kaykai]|uniref:Gem-associated protein 2 n=1 Tax=Trichogramma kaykai TaxID=54128 RepID=A0ABD2X1L8_9HYME
MNDPFKEPVLYSGKLDEESLDLSSLPATGEEYIKRVIYEARNCDDVAYAKIDDSRFKKPTLNVKPLPECIKAPDCMGPTQEWQNHQISEFSQIRMEIAQFRDEIKNKKKRRLLCKVKLPDISDQEGWIKVCTTTNENYIEPLLSIILSINQPSIEQVLEYLVNYLEKQELIQAELGRWLYALLSALELPLNPDMCSCLRSLARYCASMRAKLESTKINDVVSLNLFICLVARYFRQLDLADP